MSYDLMVFEPSAAPRQRNAFLGWSGKQTLWIEPHGYGDPSVTSPGLAAWFTDMIEIIPSFNGRFEIGPDTDPAGVAEYCIGVSMIYASFRRSRCRDAYAHVRHLAAIHRVGFFDVSGEDGEIVFPPM